MREDIPFADENPVGMEQNDEARSILLLYDIDTLLDEEKTPPSEEEGRK